MAESPARHSFDELVELLRKHDLEWLVVDTTADIALGRTQKRILTRLPRRESEYQEVFLAPGEFKDGGRRGEFLTSEPFSDGERLVRLIEATKNVIVEIPAMEANILRATGLEVTFATGTEAPAEPDVNWSIVEVRSREASTLRKALTQVLVEGMEQK